MDWTMVGALGEWAGAIAVVASLLYVGGQVHQNNRIARAEAYRDVTLSWAKMLHLWANDPAAAKVLVNFGGDIVLADLPEDVRNPYLLRTAATIRVFETIYRQVTEGIFEEDALDMLWGQAAANTPLFQDAWRVLRGSYSPTFRNFVEERYGLTGLSTENETGRATREA